MRGANKTNLPSKLYFLESDGGTRGPWMNRPSTLIKNHPNWTLIVYELDSNKNYIKQ